LLLVKKLLEMLIAIIGLICVCYSFSVAASLLPPHGCAIDHATSVVLPVKHVWAVGKQGKLPWLGIAADSSCTVIGFPHRLTYITIPLAPWRIALCGVIGVVGFGFVVAASRHLQNDFA
jgi:hypothetical protein